MAGAGLLPVAALAIPLLAQVPHTSTVHLVGDSIARGFGMYAFGHPHPLNRIQDVLRLLLGANLVASPAVSVVMLEPDPATLGPGDWVFYEDAGENGLEYGAYRHGLEEGVIAPVLGRNRRLVLMTMFDYSPFDGRCAECEFDRPTVDRPDKTINDAIRDASASHRVGLIDMNEEMDRLEAHLQERGFGSAVFPDGVHPNVFGNVFMALVLLREMGADVESWSLRSLHELVGDLSAFNDGEGDVTNDLRQWPFLWPRDLDRDGRIELLEEIRWIAAGRDRGMKSLFSHGFEPGHAETEWAGQEVGRDSRAAEGEFAARMGNADAMIREISTAGYIDLSLYFLVRTDGPDGEGGALVVEARGEDGWLPLLRLSSLDLHYVLQRIDLPATLWGRSALELRFRAECESEARVWVDRIRLRGYSSYGVSRERTAR